jgi:hypothetical protein
MSSDYDILRRANERETDPRDRRPPEARSWSARDVGATRADINRLEGSELIRVNRPAARVGPGEYSATRYKLTEEGKKIIWAASMEREFRKVPRIETLEAMSLVVGFDDIKLEVAKAIEKRKKINFLFEGDPASAKSLILEAVNSIVPDSYMAFGSRTSAAGLSDVLFMQQPGVLCLDEADKMRGDVHSIMLGLMERGVILETKSQKIRGITLNTMVFAACNSSAKFTKEFLSRFAWHFRFPRYTRDEFIDVSRGFLGRSCECPESLAILIGQMVFDLGLGDIRQVRAVWDTLDEPTEREVKRVIDIKLKYGILGNNHRKSRQQSGSRLPGI